MRELADNNNGISITRGREREKRSFEENRLDEHNRQGLPLRK